MGIRLDNATRQNLLQKVQSPADIDRLTDMANKIWNEYFPPLIGQTQVDYMLEKFQSAESIHQQLDKGWQYFFITEDNLPVGYIGMFQNRRNRVVELSKFYLQADSRRKAIGRLALTALIKNEIQPEMEKIVLRVNKGNSIAIAAYQKFGFVKSHEAVVDIGNGFVMDDYIFEKTLNTRIL